MYFPAIIQQNKKNLFTDSGVGHQLRYAEDNFIPKTKK